ncbi:MAG: hypothetical protein COA57_14405 [Flavobacteriales bacterium]|nr:MAG: hypothetical protein COA57_14405 [Flavobacteriales bacterium]
MLAQDQFSFHENVFSREKFILVKSDTLDGASASDKRNIVSFDPIHVLIFGHLTLSYERLSKSQKSTIKTPVSMSIFLNYISTGIDYKIYPKSFPTTEKRLKYFLGPSLLVGYKLPDFLYAEAKLSTGLTLLRGHDMLITIEGAAGLGGYGERSEKKLYPAWNIGIAFGGLY